MNPKTWRKWDVWKLIYINILIIDLTLCLTDVFETPEREHSILASNTDILSNGKATIIKKVKNNKINLFISDGKKDKPITHEVFYFDTDHDFDDDFKKGVPRSQIPKKYAKHKGKKKSSTHKDPAATTREYVPMSSDLSNAEQYAENLDTNYNGQDMNDNRDVDGGMTQGMEAVSSDSATSESDDIRYNAVENDNDDDNNNNDNYNNKNNNRKNKNKGKENKEHFVVGDDTMEDINEISAADSDDEEESFDSEDDNEDEKEQNDDNGNNNDNNNDQEDAENNRDKEMEEEEENYEYEDEPLDNYNHNNNKNNRNNYNNDDNDEALDEDSVNESGNSGDNQNLNERNYDNENTDDEDDNSEEDRDNPSGSERNEVLGSDSNAHTRNTDNKNNQNQNQNENQAGNQNEGSEEGFGMPGRVGGRISMGGRGGMGGQIAGQIGGRLGGAMGGNVNVNTQGSARLGGKLNMGGRLGRLGSKMVRIGGRLIRIKGGHPAPKIKLKLSISLKRWDWRRYMRGFKFESVGKASIGFLIDGMVGQHIKMIQRWAYNLALMFKRGSYLSFATFGTKLDLVNDFKTFTSAADIRGQCEQLKPSMGRKLGEVLGEYYKLFEKVKKEAKLNMILFIFLKGNTQGQKSKLEQYGNMLKNLGVKIFIFCLGSATSMSEMEMITNRQRIFQAANYKAVVLGGTGLKVGGREGMKTPIFNLLQKRFSRWLGVQVGIASMHATHHHGHSHREWWYKLWGWYKYLGLQYGSIGKANLAFVIDGTNAEMIMFIQRYVYNLIRLFQLQGTYVTIMAFGRDQYRIAKWVSFVSPQEIQKFCASIPFIQTKQRNTHAALAEMYEMFSQQMKNGNPNLVFLIMTGPSSDKNEHQNIGIMFRKLGIRVWAVGAGAESNTVTDEVSELAFDPAYATTGAMSAIVQKPIFAQMSLKMTEAAGQGNVMALTQGNAVMLRVQALWNWRTGMKSIKYGFLSRANIGFLIDGVNPNNFGYTRRMVYNLIRMYSLSGTYVTIMVYGSKVYRVSNFAQFRNAVDIKKACTAMPKVANGVRKTGAALSTMLSAFSNAPPGNPMLVYVLTHGPSADSVELPASQLRQFGVKVFSIGLGEAASPKDLSTMAFSSTLIYKSSTNGMVNTMANIQGACVSIAGTVSKACGPSGHIACKKSDIIKNWQWKTQGIPFSYSVVNRASIGFLIDGTNSHHFDILQKLVYNIYKLFGPGTFVSILTYSGDVYREMAMFRQYSDATAMQTAFSSICYKGMPGRKTGAALAAYEKEFNKTPGGKKLLFLLTTGKSDDDVAQPAKDLVSKGVSIFALGIGEKADAEEIKKISRYFLTMKWRGLLTSMVKMQNSLVKVCGRYPGAQPDTGPLPLVPPGPPQIKPPMSPPSGAFIASSASQPIGHLQTNWNWYNMMTGLKPAGLAASNIVLLLDVTKSEHMDVMTRFISNVVRLFERASEVTLITYGSKPSTVFANKVFKSDDELKETLKEVKPEESKSCNTGRALMEVKKTMLPRLKDSQKKGICFVITRTKSSDDISKGAEQLKGAGLVLAGFGIGADYSQEELATISTTGQLAMSGSAGDMVVFLSRLVLGLNMIVNGLPKTTTISLNSMGGKNGGTLVSSIMNTIQTSSIAGETAGQKGMPNTGAEAGDAQGADTGKGSAGAPEQGGPTTPSGEGGAEGAAPETPSGGGPTGAGGSDAAAAGGVAGASEAIAGQSAQDGGKGGSADGGLTGGPNAGKVTATGGAAPESPTEAAGSNTKEAPTPAGVPGTPEDAAAGAAGPGAAGETPADGAMGDSKGPNAGGAAEADVNGDASAGGAAGIKGAGGLDGGVASGPKGEAEAGIGAGGEAGGGIGGGKVGGDVAGGTNGKIGAGIKGGTAAGGGIAGGIDSGKDDGGIAAAGGNVDGGKGSATGLDGEGGAAGGGTNGGVDGAAGAAGEGAVEGGADSAAGGADAAVAGGIKAAADGGEINGGAKGGKGGKLDGEIGGGKVGGAGDAAGGAAGDATGGAVGDTTNIAGGAGDSVGGAAGGGTVGDTVGGADAGGDAAGGAAGGGTVGDTVGGADAGGDAAGGAAGGGTVGDTVGGADAGGNAAGEAAGGAVGDTAGGAGGAADVAGGAAGDATGEVADGPAGGAAGDAAIGATGKAAGDAPGGDAGGAVGDAAIGATGKAAGDAAGEGAGGATADASTGDAPGGDTDGAAGGTAIGATGKAAGNAAGKGPGGAAADATTGDAPEGAADGAAGGAAGGATIGTAGKAAGGAAGEGPGGAADGATTGDAPAGVVDGASSVGGTAGGDATDAAGGVSDGAAGVGGTAGGAANVAADGAAGGATGAGGTAGGAADADAAAGGAAGGGLSGGATGGAPGGSEVGVEGEAGGDATAGGDGGAAGEKGGAAGEVGGTAAGGGAAGGEGGAAGELGGTAAGGGVATEDGGVAAAGGGGGGAAGEVGGAAGEGGAVGEKGGAAAGEVGGTAAGGGAAGGEGGAAGELGGTAAGGGAAGGDGGAATGEGGAAGGGSVAGELGGAAGGKGGAALGKTGGKAAAGAGGDTAGEEGGIKGGGVDGRIGRKGKGKVKGSKNIKAKDAAKDAAIEASGGAGMITEGGVAEGVKGGPSPTCGTATVANAQGDCNTAAATPAAGNAAGAGGPGVNGPGGTAGGVDDATGAAGGGTDGAGVNGAGAADGAAGPEGVAGNAATPAANGAAAGGPEAIDGNIAGGSTGGPSPGSVAEEGTTEGPAGTEGTPNAQGSVGADGAPGAEVAAGADGAAGVKGAAGAEGAAGTEGTVGAAGVTGTEPAAGASAANSVNGVTNAAGGVAGKKPNAVAGVNGAGNVAAGGTTAGSGPLAGAGAGGKAGPNAGGVAGNGGGGGKCCCVQKDCISCNPQKDCGTSLCNPRLKTCIIKQPIIKSFASTDATNAISGTDDKEINTIQKLLEDFYGEDSLKKKRRHIATPEKSGTDIQSNTLIKK